MRYNDLSNSLPEGGERGGVLFADGTYTATLVKARPVEAKSGRKGLRLDWKVDADDIGGDRDAIVFDKLWDSDSAWVGRKVLKFATQIGFRPKKNAFTPDEMADATEPYVGTRFDVAFKTTEGQRGDEMEVDLFDEAVYTAKDATDGPADEGGMLDADDIDKALSAVRETLGDDEEF
jgi:hypothetical protein